MLESNSKTPTRQERQFANERILLGTRYLSAGDTANAIVELQHATQLDPYNCEAWYQLGLATEELNDSSEALRAYARAFTLEPSLKTTVRFGQYLRQLGQPQLASCVFGSFLLKFPTPQNLSSQIIQHFSAPHGRTRSTIEWLPLTPPAAFSLPPYRVRFYSDQKFIPEGTRYAPFFYPFWGRQAHGDLVDSSFDTYIEHGAKLFESTSLAECDIVVFPADYEAWLAPFVHEMWQQVKAAQKKMLIFYHGDSSDEIDIPQDECIILQTSLYSLSRKPNQFSLPVAWEDLSEHYLNSQIPLRDKPERPIIGFCGQLITHEPKHPRNLIIRHLVDDPHVSTNFVIREGWGGGLTSKPSIYDHLRVRLEYLENAINCDYGLAIRGGGNFSYRLYELMCVGRIPLYIDTYGVLPFDHLINWSELVLWIAPTDHLRGGEVILNFNRAISAEQFRERQLRCRQVWETFISTVGFYSNVWRILCSSGVTRDSSSAFDSIVEGIPDQRC